MKRAIRLDAPPRDHASRETHFRFDACFLADLFFVTRFDEPLPALTFRARAARAFTRFCASFARASGDNRRRFFTAFLLFFAASRAIVFLAGARPTAGRTSAMSTPAP